MYPHLHLQRNKYGQKLKSGYNTRYRTDAHFTRIDASQERFNSEVAQTLEIKRNFLKLKTLVKSLDYLLNSYHFCEFSEAKHLIRILLFSLVLNTTAFVSNRLASHRENLFYFLIFKHTQVHGIKKFTAQSCHIMPSQTDNMSELNVKSQ